MEPVSGQGSSVSLAEVLERVILALWKKRTKQELLLDLGERKEWTEDDFSSVCRKNAGWFGCELGLSLKVRTQAQTQTTGEPVPSQWKGDSLRERLRAVLPPSPMPAEPRKGVTKLSAELSVYVGAGAKSIDNALSEGLQADAPAHRWLLLLARLGGPPEELPPIELLLYHRRSRRAVDQWLSNRATSPDSGMDISDALVCFSLLSLIQRRRPTSEALASRGKDVSRRDVAKPVAAMEYELIQHGQIRPLICLALSLSRCAKPERRQAGRVLALTVLECVLTQTHLLVHLPRKGDFDEKKREERYRDYGVWLDLAAKAVADTNDLLGDEEADCFRFRIAWMRARAAQRDGERVRAGRDVPIPEGIRQLPYLKGLLTIDAVMAKEDTNERIDLLDSGVLMLLPQARKRGLIR